ncbi:hypothetical protein C0584_04090 [Candidatus Parcubacteria bacterium]|nr:MAG: hypothetical protein C0584_04090 [Candidatus Parcubacteria bacterium]
MNEKDILKKLNSYKAIKADKTWKKENRQVLFNQIMNSSSGNEADFSFAKIANAFKIYSDTFYNGIVKRMGQPVLLTSMIVLVVLGGGVMSIDASRDATPGDSLYIAKKISEKTKFALTFSEKKKAQLNVSFAENRAKEIAQVMADEKPETEKQEIVERLTGDFKKEISNVKNRIEKIAKEVKETEENVEVIETEESLEENIFTANLGKGDEGLSIESEVEVVELAEEDLAEELAQEEETEVELEDEELVELAEETDTEGASSSDAVEEEAVETNSQEMLSEVRELIESDDFDATLEKLDAVSVSLDKEIESGEVKGVEESLEDETISSEVVEEAATSTEEN